MKFAGVGLRQVGFKSFRQNYRREVDRAILHEEPFVLMNRTTPELVAMPPELFEELVSDHRMAHEIKRTLPLLMAAVAAKAAIPSDTLAQLDIEFPFDWRAVNEFSTRFGFGATHDEDGAPLAGLTGQAEHVEEFDQDLPPVRASAGSGG